MPVVFTRVVLAPGGRDAGWFAVKVPGLAAFEEGSEWIACPPDPAPLPGETMVTKQYASAFFGTSLASTLRASGVDTTIVVGLLHQRLRARHRPGRVAARVPPARRP